MLSVIVYCCKQGTQGPSYTYDFTGWLSASMSTLSIDTNHHWILLKKLRMLRNFFSAMGMKTRKHFYKTSSAIEKWCKNNTKYGPTTLTWFLLFPTSCWSCEMNLNECKGTTRSSWSAVSNNIQGYWASSRDLIVCKGEYLEVMKTTVKNNRNACFISIKRFRDIKLIKIYWILRLV